MLCHTKTIPRKTETCHKEKKPWNVWVNGLEDVLSQDYKDYNLNPLSGYQSKLIGMVLGIDRHFAQYFYAGALGGYTSSHMDFKQKHGTAQVNIGWNDYTAYRNIIYPGVNLTAKNSHTGHQLLSHADTDINFNFKGFTIQPFDSFDYVAQNEHGLQLAGCLCFQTSKWTLAPKLSWVREVRIKGNNYTAEFKGTDSPFTVISYYPDRSLLSPGVLLSGNMLQDKLCLSLYYNGEFTHGYNVQNYGGQASFEF